MAEFRDIHDIYDVILHLIMLIWLNHFLQFMGIDLKIKKVLKTDLITFKGKKLRLDFLVIATDSKAYNFEFEYPYADEDDLDRFGFYNIVAENFLLPIVETIVINFSKFRKNQKRIFKSGFSKSFHPRQEYIGECDFELHIENIKNKVDTYIQTGNIETITPLEELALLLRCVEYGFENKAKVLKWVCEVVQYRELFLQERYNYITAILKLELENLISSSEKESIEKGLDKKFAEVVHMSPEIALEIQDVIHQVNEKTLQETREKAYAEVRDIYLAEGEAKGISEGRSEGRSEGIDECFDALSQVLENLDDENTADEILKNFTKLVKKE